MIVYYGSNWTRGDEDEYGNDDDGLCHELTVITFSEIWRISGSAKSTFVLYLNFG